MRLRILDSGHGFGTKAHMAVAQGAYHRDCSGATAT
jgi:hypothetical protein